MAAFNFIYLLTAPSPNAVTFGVGPSTYEFEQGTQFNPYNG